MIVSFSTLRIGCVGVAWMRHAADAASGWGRFFEMRLPPEDQAELTRQLMRRYPRKHLRLRAVEGPWTCPCCNHKLYALCLQIGQKIKHGFWDATTKRLSRLV